MAIHQRTHPEYVDGCFGCKISTISFGTVPGGAKDAKSGVSAIDQRHKDLDRYYEKRKAGEQPDGTTKKAMDRSERKQDLFESRESDIRDNNPPEAMKKMRKALLNER